MSISIAALIADGLPALSTINAFLSGITRREFVELIFTDYAGNTGTVVLEIDPRPIGQYFSVFNVDLLAAIEDVVDLSSGELNTVRFIADVTDYSPSTPDPESNVQERGVMSFAVTGNTKAGKPTSRSIAIPSIADQYVIKNGRDDLRIENDVFSPGVEPAAAQFTGLGLATRTFVIDNRDPLDLQDAQRVNYRRRKRRK